MKGLCIEPWHVRFWRRHFETARQKKRRHIRAHREFVIRMREAEKRKPPAPFDARRLHNFQAPNKYSFMQL